MAVQSSGRSVTKRGSVIAALGSCARGEPSRVQSATTRWFLFASLLPLVVGLQLAAVGVALAFATVLWLFAAGVVMLFWLRPLELPASLPNLTGAALLGHLVWGLTLGGLYHAFATWQQH